MLVTHEADIAQRAQRCLYFKDGRLLRDQQLRDQQSRDQQLCDQPSAVSHSPAVI